jgi:hypothetical protein
LLSLPVVLILAGAALTGCASRSATHSQVPLVRTAAPVPVRSQDQQQIPRLYEGRIKDVRAALGILILIVGKGKETRELRFDIREARIVGPSGAEWKGQDLQVGDRVRVELTADATLVQQVSVLADSASGIE